MSTPSSPRPLPVDSKQLSSKSHVILRLDQLQRAIQEDPGRYDLLEEDRSLNHVRKEVRSLLEALMKAVQAEVEAEKQQLKRAGELLDSWQSEAELKDILMLDSHRRQTLYEKISRCQSYTDWTRLVEEMQLERERIFSKYQGFFEGQQTDLNNKKIDTQKKLKPLQPRMDEWRVKREQLLAQQLTINYYYQQSTHYLVVGLGALGALAIAGHFSGIWGGLVWGLFAGYSVFSYLASRFAFVTDKAMQELYDFLIERFPLKEIKPFFRYEDKENPTQPTRFDASRGDYLSQMLQKQIMSTGAEFGVIERQRLELANYLQFLEGRKQWAHEQLRRIARFEQKPEPEAPPEPPAQQLVIDEVPGSGELAKIPPMSSEIPEPELTEIPSIVLPVGIPNIEPKAIAGRKVRPAKLGEGTMPDRAS